MVVYSFSWMAYFAAVLALMLMSLVLTTLCSLGLGHGGEAPSSNTDPR